MKKVHFFKAKSRIGLITIPNGQKQLNLGVENAPDTILTAEFLKKFKGSKYLDFVFPNPEYIDSSKFNEILALNLKDFKDLINEKILRSNAQDDGVDETQVVIGGDNCVTLSSILADLERIVDTKVFRLIHFDSHSDMNSYKGSPSKNFHGMYLRPFFDDFDIPEIEQLITKKMDPKNCLFIGNLDLDKEESEFFKLKGFNNITQEQIQTFQSDILKEIKAFVETADYLHINFDIDVFDKTLAPATGIPAKHGLLKMDIFPILEIIAKHPNFSFDLCEVNPKKEGAEQTIKLAQEILSTVLQ